ncbi:MAG TPA: hypothetical protein VHT28_19065 [Silvibacterium sp.]|jgi:type IV secretion system protein VirB10|nr:hypothetical protein [Silvibacterium sp.]
MKKTWSITVWAALSASIAGAQTASPPEPATPPTQATSETATQTPTTPASPESASPTATPAPATPTKTIEVPAGTKVLLSLNSGVNTKTAQPGDGVYLSSTFPVVSGGHVIIPSGVYVQGVIDSVVRPGHVKGRAQVTMHFTTLIFPNGSVVSIPGTVNNIPGSDGPRVKGNEGTIEQAGSKGKDVGKVATTAASGAGLGGIIGAASDHPGAGVGYGALAGGVGGILYTLFTRGNEIILPQGQTIEMIFQRPLLLEEANLTAATAPGFVPAGQQPQPLAKPVARPRILCPLGTAGCS